MFWSLSHWSLVKNFLVLGSLICLAPPLLAEPAPLVAGSSIPRSVAFRSGYTRTANEEEVAEILGAVAAANPHWVCSSIGKSHEGRPIQVLECRERQSTTPAAKPLTIVILGGIHAGECDGKEALLDLVGEIAGGKHPHWIDGMRLVCIPSLNPDGNSRRAVDHRPGQLGPAEGMGTRANARGLDLNRDFIKLETAEIRALVQTLHQIDADVLIDLHTTNGSQHRYELTYDPPHHPATPPGIRSFLREGLLPEVTQRVDQQHGLSLFYYGNFDRGLTRWSTYGYEARYGINYMGLRGRMGILSESYSYASYETRVVASHAFLTAILDYLAPRAAEVRALLTAGFTTAAERDKSSPVPLTARLEPFPERVRVKGYGAEGQPEDHLVQFYGDFQSALSIAPPQGYFVDAADEKVLALLAAHGIASEPIVASDRWRCEGFEMTRCEVAAEPFQGHHMVRLEGNWREIQIDQGRNGHWVATGGPLTALIATILEPESPDSVATWNVLAADRLRSETIYPIIRVGAR